ncbi:hypothetical protein SKAU_G00121540 [Synaphobranchus kaupii]|uniref:Uncharacterized protein n=1 Tax=Synaphobranchus kaupii TaxID=118154 RepID=A0A9Q1FPF2_SYNKA|nr:hypothetical protein SKAU_G00121540 [Synaphobranchus kaupii]
MVANLLKKEHFCELKMEVSSSGESTLNVPEGGLWNSPRVRQYTKETQHMLQLMMREAKLTQRQQRELKMVIKKEGALPVICHSRSVTSSPQSNNQEKAAGLAGKRQKRSAEMCRSGNSYKREMFLPSATRDLEKEKRRLQNILAVGKEEPKLCPPESVPSEKGEPEDRDRFQEVVVEIKDRMDFLDEMSAFGKRKLYQNIIEAEISQKIRELELIDKTCSANLKNEPDRGAGEEMPQKLTDVPL